MGDPYLVKIQKHELKELKNGRKEQYLKRLNFLPYVEYKPSIIPSENGKTLLKDLTIYEKITDDHVQFENKVNEQLKKEEVNVLMKFMI